MHFGLEGVLFHGSRPEPYLGSDRNMLVRQVGMDVCALVLQIGPGAAALVTRIYGNRIHRAGQSRFEQASTRGLNLLRARSPDRSSFRGSTTTRWRSAIEAKQLGRSVQGTAAGRLIFSLKTGRRSLI